MTRDELKQTLTRIAEDQVSDGVDGRNILRHDASQRALIEQQAGVIQRQWDYIAQLKQTISVHEQAGLEGLVHDYNDHQRIEQQAKEIAGLRDALRELHAIVKGECPSLLNEDSGGDAKLAIEIEALLKEEHP